MPSDLSHGERLARLETRVDAQDEVLGQMAEDLSSLAKNVDRIVGWFTDKRTHALLVIVVGVVFGPDAAKVAGIA